jgi:nicotinamide-nucleotide adenylyltransferase
MIEDRDWEALVPDPVVDVVRETNGIERIQRVSETDANGSR